MTHLSPTLFLAMLATSGIVLGARAGAGGTAVTVEDGPDQIRITTPQLEAAVRKKGYVSGVAAQSFLDKKTGFRDAGFGLDIVDWIMQPGSDEAYRDKLDKELVYEFGNLYHGNRPKRSLEGPQICTQAKVLSPRIIQGTMYEGGLGSPFRPQMRRSGSGSKFVAIEQSFNYKTAAPGLKKGSLWEQTLVFPEGKRYFLSSDRITTVNGGKDLFLRLDMPGHIKHNKGDTFSEVYLSYLPKPRIPSSEYLADFAPDQKHLYVRNPKRIPKRIIRAYHLRDPKTGKDGPWIAGMTLNPAVVTEAWSHQRGYVCMIEEFGPPAGKALKPGDSFSAAFLVGYFDSIEEMHKVYDTHKGETDLLADESGWLLLKKTWNKKEGKALPRLAFDREPKRTGSTAVNRAEESQRLLAKKLARFQDQKFGLFVHWGMYSQWGCIESWPLVEVDKWARPDDLPAWVERGKDINRFRNDYWKLNRTFNPRHFDPEAWADAAKRAGMKYFVFTTKHHDGFSMWDTKQSDYRITGPETPYRTAPQPDVVKRLFDTFRAKGFGIGAYFSKADWHHPGYWSPDAPAPTRNPNYDTAALPHRWSGFREFVHNQIEELMTGYGPIDILWLDAGQVRPPKQDLDMPRLAKMARSHQPGLIIVDRTVGGEFENYRTPEQEVPDKPLPYVWESCITMGDQWSYKLDDKYKSPRQLIHLLVDVVAKGGNLLLNIGPDAEGRFPPTALQRLKAIGDWMSVNSDAIYGTRPIAPYKQGQVALTRKGGRLFATYLAATGEQTPPAQITLTGFRPKTGTVVRMLGARTPAKWQASGDQVVIETPKSALSKPPCEHAWTYTLELQETK